MQANRPSDVEARRQYVDNVLSSGKCTDCGTTDIRVLEFDHRDPSLKHAGIGRAVWSMGMERLKEEINKCDIRCANCHSIRHYRESRVD